MQVILVLATLAGALLLCLGLAAVILVGMLAVLRASTRAG